MNPVKLISVMLSVAWVMSACQPAELANVTATPDTVLLAYTPIPTAEIFPTETMTQPPTVTATHTATATHTVTATHTPTATHTATATPTLTHTPTITPTSTETPRPLFEVLKQSEETPQPVTFGFGTVNAEATAESTEEATVEALSVPFQEPHFVFERPIAQTDGLVYWVDRTYPYGGTQFGMREVHLGVEFVNPRHTQIYAVGDGVVYYAGDDTTLTIGPRPKYYGNVIIIQHDILSPEGERVYTLYGHLQTIQVAVGDVVKTGDKIATIGDSGIAIGPHLHFEVRVGDGIDYRATRNPDLWIRPFREYGVLVGRLTATNMESQGVVIFVRTPTNNRETYTYGGDEVNSDPSWNENFSLGDLPEGDYEVIVSDRNGRVYFRQTVTIEPRKITWLDIAISR